jgi:hypothetical protein
MIEGNANTAISTAHQKVTYTVFNKIKTIIVEPTENADSSVYLYATDIALPLPWGASWTDMENAMNGHILTSDDLMGLYARIK